MLRQGAASLTYGWEYQGACPRLLVMTPAAEATQLALASALHQRFGGLVLGLPALRLIACCSACRAALCGRGGQQQ